MLNNIKSHKEFAQYVFRRMSVERGIELISSLPILPEHKKVIIDVDIYKKPQKQLAYDEHRDVKTISRRYNKALEMSAGPLIAYISSLLNRPGK